MPPKSPRTPHDRHTVDYENRIFAQLVLLVALPLLIVGLLAGVNFDRMQRAHNDMVLNTARQTAENEIEATLTNLRSYYIGVIEENDYTWMHGFMDPPYSRFSQLRTTQNLLRGGNHLDKYVQGYTYVNTKHGWALSNNGMYKLSTIYNLSELRDFQKNQEDGILNVQWCNNPVEQPNYAGSYINLSGYLLVLRTTSAMSGTTSMLIVNLNLDPFIDQNENWQQLGYRLIVRENRTGRVVLSTDDALAAELEGQTLSPGIQSWNNWDVSVGKGSANGLTYYVAAPQTNWWSIAGSSLLIAAGVALGMVVVLAICRWTSARLYEPVRNVVISLNGVLGQRQIDQDEFDYLLSGVNQLAEDQKALEGMVVLQNRQLRGQFLLHMLRSEVTAQAIEKTLQELKISPCHCYRLLALDIAADPNATGAEREALALTAAQQLPREVTSRLFIEALPVDDVVVLVVGAAEDAELQESARHIAKASVQVVRTIFGRSSRVGASMVFHSLTHMRSAHQEALEALRNRAAAPDEARGAMIAYNPPEDVHVKNGYDMLLQNEITAAMTACNKKETERLLTTFLQRMDDKDIRGYERQFYLQRLVTAMLSVAENAGLSVTQVMSGQQGGLFERLGKVYGRDKLLAFLRDEVALPVIELLTGFRQNTSSELVKKVVALIKQTGGDLTLNECAERLNYHPSYIWKVLKAERDTNFTDLVNAQKLEMAKELLLTSDMTVAQVAETLHYANVQNFIRFFSKEVGVTPGKYKKEHQNR